MPKGSHLTPEHQQEAGRKPRQSSPRPASSKVGAAGAADDDRWAQQYQQARTMEKVESAKMRKLKRERLSGILVLRTEADSAMASIVGAVRAALSLAPGYLASDLTPNERQRCEAALRASIQRAMADAASALVTASSKLDVPA